MMEKIDRQSLNMTEEKKKQLEALFPEVFTEGKIDFEKLKLILGDEIDESEERFGLQWAGKKDCFKSIQEPSIGTLQPCKEESVNWDSTENLFIEGENLEVLKLLQKSYYGKVKMIYIDPPYNTGNEFIYPDDYKDKIASYLAYTGQTNNDGYKFSTNTETTGRYHSNWLNMMYPRLFLARNLLTEDGVIFISIDDHEVHNLRALCNEIFGEENFVANIIWQRAYAPVNLKKTFSQNHDYILCYSRNTEIIKILGIKRSAETNSRYKNLDNDHRGNWKSDNLSVGPERKENIYEITTPSGRKVLPPSGYCWRLSKERFEEFRIDNRIWFGKDGNNVPSIKRFLSEVCDTVTPLTLWTRDEVGDTQEARREVKKIFDDHAYFDYPKPVRLIKRLLELTTKNNDIILDFFSGSSTTAHAVLKLNKEDGGNRKFIMVQLPEACDPKSEAYKAGYKTIADIGKERIRRAINKIKESDNGLFETDKQQDLGFKVFKLSPSNFPIWNGNIEAQTLENQLKENILQFETNESIQENILTEILLKSGFQLTEKIVELTLANKTVFSIADGALLICLEPALTKELIQEVRKIKPEKFICLDSGFQNNDELKTNAIQIMKSHEVKDFRTV